jgi:YHS domain-containing protein
MACEEPKPSTAKGLLADIDPADVHAPLPWSRVMAMPRLLLVLVFPMVCSAMLLAGCASSDNKATEADTATAKVKPGHVDPNAPLCPVGDEPLGVDGEPVYAEYNGKTIGFCCEDCRKKFNADPVAYLHKIK